MSAINRYKFTEKTVTQAKNFLKGKAKKEAAFLKRFKGEIRGNKLFLDGREVIPDNKVDAYIRQRIYAGKTPMSRDSAFYRIAKDVVNVSRKKIDDFLKKQNVT